MFLQPEELVANIGHGEEHVDEEGGNGIHVVMAKDAVQEDYVLSSIANLIDLATRPTRPSKCNICGTPVEVSNRQFGTSLILSWVRNIFFRLTNIKVRMICPVPSGNDKL